MPLWSQHLVVLLAVVGCVAFIARGAYRALQGRKSSLNACGSCKSCATNEPVSKAPAATKIAFFPVELLHKKR